MGYKKSKVSIASIVEAGMRVLARQGYARTSLMDIANEVGMSKGAVHYHFPTKEALMAKVLQTACDTVADRALEAWTEVDSPNDALRSALRTLWRVRAGLSDEAKVVADLLAQSLHDESLRAPLAEYYRFAAAQVEQHLGGHFRALGATPRMPIERIPRLLHAILDGMLMQKIVDSDAIDEEYVLDVLEALALSLLDFGPPTEPPAPG
ncbi:MAG: TetR/AcrR family transcriptional regulator [Myxococcales bacterium]|nr:TetR/AcrR family transcriptional regulator [Myxococcales bacterium]